jgi:TonB family protein
MPDGAANGAVAEPVAPDVQSQALRSIHGKFVVQVRVSVDQAGNVTDAAYESEGPSAYFAKAALAAAKKSKFKSAQAGVPGKWILQYRFTNEGAQITAAAAQ